MLKRLVLAFALIVVLCQPTAYTALDVPGLSGDYIIECDEYEGESIFLVAFPKRYLLEATYIDGIAEVLHKLTGCDGLADGDFDVSLYKCSGDDYVILIEQLVAQDGSVIGAVFRFHPVTRV